MEELKSKVLSGASWLLATQWVLRISGLISTAVLARVLTPADFGTVAAILALVSVTDAFFEFGLGASLIKDQNPSRSHFDSVWTLRIIKTFAMAAAVLALAPFFANYSEVENLPEMALVISTSIALKGFQNVGLFKFQKELEIKKIFLARVLPKLLGVFTSILLALYLRSFWALIYAQLALSIYTVAFSYFVSDYRPRLCLSEAGSVWSFSKWVFIKNLSRQLFGASDRLLLSGLIDKSALGNYTVSSNLTSMLSVKLFAPAGQIMTPAVAKIQDTKGRLRRVFLQTSSAYAAIVVPAGVGVLLVSDELALIVLGDQWLEAGKIIGMLAIFFTARSITSVLSNSNVILGLHRLSALLGLGVRGCGSDAARSKP